MRRCFMLRSAIFFFSSRRRHTRSLCDWSSDVCSSDLSPPDSCASCALGAAYDGMYLLPREAGGVRPVHLERLFDCLEYTLRSCPEGCKKRLTLASMILHLNDDHHWTRESIAQWVAPPPETKPEDKGPVAS